ncbi:CBO0543 family protein [Bacillus sp. V3B]|uniref:CBO0543 family protein n=1 Tax=Bacillus sp. V3B TaxID=2804915 RepID=UPI00210A414D|nr:CBO0543 family protein [Bacillus sp. V3B]
MKERKFSKLFLRLTLVVALGALPITLRKPPIKDWIIVYLFNAVTNGIIDNIFTSLKIIKYPVHLLPKLFEKSVNFDFFCVFIYYNPL